MRKCAGASGQFPKTPLPGSLSEMRFENRFVRVARDTPERQSPGRGLMRRETNTLGLLCSLASVYLRLGPRVFRHLNFNCRVARFYRERVGVEGVRSEAANAVTTDPSAIGNKHELSTSPPMPVA